MKPVPAALLRPMMIEPLWLKVMFSVWSRGKIESATLEQARAEWKARLASKPRLEDVGAPVDGTGGTLRIIGSTGVLSIEGPLFRHANLITDYSGGTTYDAVWRGLEAALENHAIASLLGRFATPGGEADGLSELGKAFRAARERKPFWSYVDGMCASAGYWLASQTERIISEETAETGSIGVRCGIVDYSAAEEMAGERHIEIISSQSPGKRGTPVNDDVIGRLQVRIDDLAELFVAAVAEGRGVSVRKVLEDFGKGDVMIASKALDAGLIDEIGNFNGTLAAIAAATTPSGRSARAEGRSMTMKSASNKPAAAAGDDNSGGHPEWQCKGCKEMMGGSADAYCAKCSTDDDDEPDGDEDEDEAKALGLNPRATAAERRARMVELVELEKTLLEATGTTKAAAAMGRIAAGAQALTELAGLRADGLRRDLRATLERGLSGANGQAPRLTLGAIQKTIPVALRGEAKKKWVAAMDKLAADADTAAKAGDEEKSTISGAMVIDAACSVPITADDFAAVQEYVAAATPVAAANYIEPHRDGEKESEEMDATAAKVSEIANKTRAMLDRNNKPAAK
jgi:ClpP class serine protease